MKQENLARLHALEKDYTPGEDTRRINSGKTFIALVAPYASGKTVIGDEVVKLEPRISLINTTTTRPSKVEDQPGFKTADDGITSSWFLEKAQQGALTNFSVIPGVDAYGTLPEDFPGEHSIGPFLPSGIEQIKRAGFNSFHAIYILTPSDLWRQFVIESRQNLDKNRFQKRALESIDSANYALEHMDDFIFLENNTKGAEGIHKLARKICDIALNNTVDGSVSPTDAQIYLNGIKEVAKELAER